MAKLSPGIIASSVNLFKIIDKFNINERQLLIEMPYISGTSTMELLKVAKICQWIKSDDVLSTTPKTKQYTTKGYKYIYRLLLYDYIKYIKPAWSSLLTKGRFESVPFFTKDIIACFFDAGLMGEPPDAEVIYWWDEVNNLIYINDMKKKTDIGRLGERLSYFYERQRTNINPIWKSIDSNLAGYDILSQTDKNNGEKLLIEVKCSNRAMINAEAILSRNEWNTACRSTNYIFHFWHITKSDEHYLAVISKETILSHIPIDFGKGLWEECSIPFSAFERQFHLTEVCL